MCLACKGTYIQQGTALYEYILYIYVCKEFPTDEKLRYTLHTKKLYKKKTVFVKFLTKYF